MEEVAKGIYRQNGTIESAVRIPLILVHPWFFGVYPSYSPCQLTQDSEKKGYNLCIEKLLESYRQTGNIITLEVAPKIESTTRRVGESAGTAGRYIVPTFGGECFARSKPLIATWDSLARFLESFRSSFYFAGGQVVLGNSLLGGCLGTALEELSVRGISGELIETCCFLPR